MRIIGNNTKSSVRRVFLHDSSQCHLCRARHGICFVKDNQLIFRDRWSASRWRNGEDLFRAGECLDLFADYVYTAIIGGVQF